MGVGPHDKLRKVGEAARLVSTTGGQKLGKKFEAAKKQVPEHPLTIEDAIPLLQKVKFAKFDETVELTARLGVDPKHADQMVRGTVVLPHGLGKSKKVLVIAGGEKQKEAQDAKAEGVVGTIVQEKSYRWESHVIEFFAIGTAVVPLNEEIAPKDIPAPTLVLSVND